MVAAAIGTVGAISAYFFQRTFSESDPTKGQPLPIPYYLWIFGCGLVFWLLVLLCPKHHYSDTRQKDIREVAKLITAITTINLCGCLVLPFRELPLLVRFLVLFQLTSNLALLLIWASETRLFMKPFDSFERDQLSFERDYKWPPYGKSEVIGAGEGSAFRGETRPTSNLYADRGDGYRGEARASGSEHGGDGVGDDAVVSGNKHDSEAGGREESGGGYGGDGGGGGDGEGQGDPEHGVRERNKEPTLKISKIAEMSIMLTAQTTAALIGFQLTNKSPSIKVLLVIVLVDQLVAYLCGLTSMLLVVQNPRAAQDFAHVGFACTVLGYILMVAMFVHWYLVLIVVLLFSVIWGIFFQRVWYQLIIDVRSRLVNNFLLFPPPNVERMENEIVIR